MRSTSFDKVIHDAAGVRVAFWSSIVGVLAVCGGVVGAWLGITPVAFLGVLGGGSLITCAAIGVAGSRYRESRALGVGRRRAAGLAIRAAGRWLFWWMP